MQHTAALAAPVLMRHARRTLLLLGAGLVWWLLLSGGAAHADDTGSTGHQAAAPDLGQVLAQTPGELVDQTTAAASSALRTAPRQVTRALTEATRTAPEPVRTAVDSLSTALEPTLTATTTAVADTVDQTVRTVRTAPPALDAVAPPTSQTPAPAAIAPPVQRPQVARHHRVHATAASSVTVGPGATHAGAGDAPADRAGSPAGDAPGIPVGPAVPSAPAVPGGPDNAPTGPMAALGGLLVAPMRLRRLRRDGDGAVRLLDPVYPPGCSPD
jgi:hypothetical protein